MFILPLLFLLSLFVAAAASACRPTEFVALRRRGAIYIILSVTPRCRTEAVILQETVTQANINDDIGEDLVDSLYSVARHRQVASRYRPPANRRVTASAASRRRISTRAAPGGSLRQDAHALLGRPASGIQLPNVGVTSPFFYYAVSEDV